LTQANVVVPRSLRTLLILDGQEMSAHDSVQEYGFAAHLRDDG
jgi:hypothetical protein